MSKTTHTPGPWLTCPAAEFDKSMGGPCGHHSMTAIYVQLAQCPDFPGDSDDWPQLIAYADDFRGDARLIAAAPALLEAALEALRSINSHTTEPIPAGVYNRVARLLGDAITAATGNAE